MAKVALQIRLDETTHKKLKIIGTNELRSLNAQLEYFLIQGIKEYEAANGEVEIQSVE